MKLVGKLQTFSVFLAFFPFVGIMPGVDLQPLFFMVSLFLFLLLFRQFQYSLPSIFVFFVCICCVFVGFLFVSDIWDFKLVATYLVMVFTVFYFYGLYGQNNIGLTKTFVFAVAIVYIFVGFVQLFVTDFMVSLVQRDVEQISTLLNTGRGVRSLTSEPSALGKIITSLNVLYVFVLVRQNPQFKNFEAVFVSFLFFSLSMFLARSAYALLLHFFLIVVLWLLIDFRSFFVFVVLGIGALFGVFHIQEFLSDFESVRLIRVFSSLLAEPDFLLSQGAFRKLFNIPITIDSLRYYGWLGAGNNESTYMSSIWTPLGELDYVVRSKAQGGVVEIILRFGLFGFPFLAFYLYMLFNIFKIRLFRNGKVIRLGLYFGLSIVLLSIQDSSPALPYALFLLVVFYKKANEIGRLKSV